MKTLKFAMGCRLAAASVGLASLVTDSRCR